MRIKGNKKKGKINVMKKENKKKKLKLNRKKCEKKENKNIRMEIQTYTMTTSCVRVQLRHDQYATQAMNSYM